MMCCAEGSCVSRCSRSPMVPYHSRSRRCIATALGTTRRFIAPPTVTRKRSITQYVEYSPAVGRSHPESFRRNRHRNGVAASYMPAATPYRADVVWASQTDFRTFVNTCTQRVQWSTSPKAQTTHSHEIRAASTGMISTGDVPSVWPQVLHVLLQRCDTVRRERTHSIRHLFAARHSLTRAMMTHQHLAARCSLFTGTTRGRSVQTDSATATSAAYRKWHIHCP